ncbi:MAG: hypothetical protein ABSA66_02395 [Roseiarcus sp.]|jgi:pimeloyl-ACP methyl ester carboxylesterase
MELAFLLITIIISSVMAGLVTYKVNESRESQCFIGKKAEELYCSAESIDRELSRFFGDRYSIIGPDQRGAGSGDDALQRAGLQLVNAKMLVGFYFSSLSPALARTIAAVTTAHASLRLWEKAGSSGGDNLLIGLDKDIVALKDALEAFKAAIIENGRSATSHRALFVAFRRPEKPMIAGRVLRVAA